MIEYAVGGTAIVLFLIGGAFASLGKTIQRYDDDHDPLGGGTQDVYLP